MKTNGIEPVNPIPNVQTMRAVGLTKREHFAALAMQGLLSSKLLTPNDNGCEYAVRMAVRSADALIEALNKEEK